MRLHLGRVFEPLVFIVYVVVLSVPSHVDAAGKDTLLVLVPLQLYSRHPFQLFLALRMTRLNHAPLTGLVEIVVHIRVRFLAWIRLLIILFRTIVIIELILIQLIVNLRDLGQRLLLMMRIKLVVRTLHLAYLASKIVPGVDTCVRL